MFINIQDNRHFKKLLTKQKYSSIVTIILNKETEEIIIKKKYLFILIFWLINSLGCYYDNDYNISLNNPNNSVTDEDHTNYPYDKIIRLNQIQCRGTHNSYHKKNYLFRLPVFNYSHEPLNVQLDMGIRQFELDIHYNFGRPLKVYHMRFIDFMTTCKYFIDCLAIIKDWSDNNTGHHILFIFIEPKDEFSIHKLTGYDKEVEDEILSIWPIERILTPDDVRGDHDTLLEAILTVGWPTLGEVRNKAMFILFDSGPMRDKYVQGNPGLKGRIMFARGGLKDEFGGFIKIDDPEKNLHKIQEAVKLGYLVRTRSDANCIEAYKKDFTRQEKALSSGAQMISTDFPAPKDGMDYWFDMPDGTPSQCNPIIAPDFCTPCDVENLPTAPFCL